MKRILLSSIPCLSLAYLVALTACDPAEKPAEPSSAETEQPQRPDHPVEAEIFDLAPHFEKVVADWQAENPKPSNRNLKIVYWTPKDREPAPAYAERLNKILDRIGDYYGEEMERNGYGNRKLKFARKSDGKLDITVVKGKKPYSSYAGGSGNEIREECLPDLQAKGIDHKKETIVIFCNMANWNAEKQQINQNSPYYASGTHYNGTAWQVDSPILNLDDLENTEMRVRDGQYGFITLGKYNSIFIGGIAHEIGHAITLPHNRQRDDEGELLGTALMGNGNQTFGEDLRGESKGSFLTFAHATRLLSHPVFSGSVKEMMTPAEVKLSELDFEPSEKSVCISGIAQSKLPLYAVVAYLDPEGGSNYDARGHTAVIEEDGSFSINCSDFQAGKPGRIHLVFLQVNGAATSFSSTTNQFSYPYITDKDGKLDLSPTLNTLLLDPIGKAVAKGDSRSANAQFEKLKKSTQKAEIIASAESLLNSLKPRGDLKKPADLDSSANSVSLSQTAASSVKVGYGTAQFDRLTGKNAALISKGRVFRNSIFAHASSELIYDLGSSWKTFSGVATLAPGAWGKAMFQIEGDGKVLWKSKLLTSDEHQAFQIDVTGIQKLTLRTLEGDGANSSDWTTWFDPMLTR